MLTIPLRVGFSHRVISTISRVAPAQKGNLAAEWLLHDRSGSRRICEVIQELVTAASSSAEPEGQNDAAKT